MWCNLTKIAKEKYHKNSLWHALAYILKVYLVRFMLLRLRRIKTIYSSSDCFHKTSENSSNSNNSGVIFMKIPGNIIIMKFIL